TAVVIYAVGGGIIEVLISPIVEACPTENKASVMSLLHSFYCWGSLGVVFLSTVFIYLFGKESWSILALLWAVIPALNAILFSQVPIEKLTEDGDAVPVRKMFKKKTFWIFVILMIAVGASELAMSQWASSFAEKGLGISKTAGDIAGPCLFALLMGLARVFYAKFSEKIKLLDFIIGSAVLCIISYLTASLSSVSAISLIACGLCGLSVGILWPGVFSIASARYPKGGTAMFALLALAGDLGCSGGPTIVGFVSGTFNDNLKTGLLAASLFPLIIIVFGLIYRKSENKETIYENNNT
ncbi:MAG: MFS transporter, partial [Oscillospiraceae bacterium]|nr:MFS transporter [Oscillospiraceae bacterium]